MTPNIRQYASMGGKAAFKKLGKEHFSELARKANATRRAKQWEKLSLVPKGMKRCSACSEIKAHAEFSKNSTSTDKKNSRCKFCSSYFNRLRPQKKYHQVGRIFTYKPDKVKFAARNALRYAIKSGKIAKYPCEKCGEIKSQGHHTDYSKPLDVVWLCSKHHHEIHRKYRNPLKPSSFRPDLDERSLSSSKAK